MAGRRHCHHLAKHLHGNRSFFLFPESMCQASIVTTYDLLNYNKVFPLARIIIRGLLYCACLFVLPEINYYSLHFIIASVINQTSVPNDGHQNGLQSHLGRDLGEKESSWRKWTPWCVHSSGLEPFGYSWPTYQQCSSCMCLLGRGFDMLSPTCFACTSHELQSSFEVFFAPIKLTIPITNCEFQLLLIDNIYTNQLFVYILPLIVHIVSFALPSASCPCFYTHQLT